MLGVPLVRYEPLHAYRDNERVAAVLCVCLVPFRFARVVAAYSLGLRASIALLGK